MRLDHWLRGLGRHTPRRRPLRRTEWRTEQLEDRIDPGEVAFALIGLSTLPDLLAPASDGIAPAGEGEAPAEPPTGPDGFRLPDRNDSGLPDLDEEANPAPLVTPARAAPPALPPGGSELDVFADDSFRTL